MNGIWLFTWKTIPEPRSWSLGKCLYCEQIQPIRISNLIKIFSFALLPLSKSIVGQTCCCDFCLNEMNVGRGLRETELGAWLPNEGIGRLAEVLQYDSANELDLPDSPSETAVHALLETADKRSSSGQLDVSTGIALGTALGVIAAAIAAFVCYQQAITLLDADVVGTTICLFLIGPCIGIVLGPIVHAVLLRRSIPRRILARAVNDYGVDPRQIQQLAGGHSRRTQAAARALY